MDKSIYRKRKTEKNMDRYNILSRDIQGGRYREIYKYGRRDRQIGRQREEYNDLQKYIEGQVKI